MGYRKQAEKEMNLLISELIRNETLSLEMSAKQGAIREMRFSAYVIQFSTSATQFSAPTIQFPRTAMRFSLRAIRVSGQAESAGNDSMYSTVYAMHISGYATRNADDEMQIHNVTIQYQRNAKG